MTKRKNNSSQKNKILIMLLILIAIIAGFILFKNRTAQNPPQLAQVPTTTPTTSSQNPETSSYPRLNKFNAPLPSDCSWTNENNISCKTPDSNITIYPHEMGRGAIVAKHEIINLNGIPWNRRFLTNDIYDVAYSSNNFDYVVGVKYNPFTDTAQTYVENILSDLK